MITITCDRCGKTISNPSVFEENAWSKVPLLGGRKDYCPECCKGKDIEKIRSLHYSSGVIANWISKIGD